jgi:integrase
VNLTAKAVAVLVLPAGKDDVIHFDDRLAGFGYRLRRGGGGEVRRSWVAQYRRAGGTRRVLLGSAEVLNAEKARAAATKVLAEVALGRDPQADRIDRREKDQLTMRGVVDEYLSARQPTLRQRTFTEVRRYLTGRYFRPLHGIPIDKITRKDIAARLVTITRESGSITAARARATLGTFYTWCLRMGLVEHNPTIGVIQPEDTKGRSRVLSDAELATVWVAGDDDFGKIVKLLVLTGCRRQEVGGMRWSELDAEAGTWTIPAERSKNGRAHELPLPPDAWDIINGVPPMASRDQLFGTRAPGGFVYWSEGKRRLNARLGAAVAPFVLHDLRRTVATRMADLGVQPHIIEQILNHQSGHKAGPAGIYNRSSYDREVRAALALWADHVRVLVEGGERLVHLFPRDRGELSGTAQTGRLNARSASPPEKALRIFEPIKNLT